MAIASLTSCLAPVNAVANDGAKPNIVVVLCDDLLPTFTPQPLFARPPESVF